MMLLLSSFVSVFVVLLVSLLLLHITDRLRGWLHRRTVYIAVLHMPLIMVVGLCSTHFSWTALSAESVFLLGMAGIALGAFGLSIARLVLMKRFVARHALLADATLQRRADDLARRLDGPAARVRVTPMARPLALTYGLRRPVIVLSTWMLEHLDQREVEAVLTHELEHVARHDYLIGWLATLLRDAFFYLPTSHSAYRRLQHEKELACDDSTISLTHRPLALASALTKVWLHALDQPELPTFKLAPSLMNGAQAMQVRIERLLASPHPQVSRQRIPGLALSLNLAALLPLSILQVLCLLLVLLSTWVGCHPIAVLGSLC